MTDVQKTILVIEDEAPLALALGNALQQEGFTVIHADDGEKGLQMAIDKHPDMLLVDIKLPRMSGIEMIRELRRDSWGKKARIIILTNISNPVTLQDAMELGAFYYFVKSDSSMSDIISAIRAQLSGQREQGQGNG
jgi:two-component system alkaline phosphatase synthesis response regulator PhoP